MKKDRFIIVDTNYGKKLINTAHISHVDINDIPGDYRSCIYFSNPGYAKVCVKPTITELHAIIQGKDTRPSFTFSFMENKHMTKVIQNPEDSVMVRKVWEPVTGEINGWTDGNYTFDTVDDLLQALNMSGDEWVCEVEE